MDILNRVARALLKRRQPLDLLERDDHVLNDVGVRRVELEGRVRAW